MERLQTLFGQPTALPALPPIVPNLLSAQDGPSLEQAVAGDPRLSRALVDILSHQADEDPLRAEVFEFIGELGEDPVRSLAISLALHGAITEAVDVPSFNKRRFTDHAYAVGFLARHLFERKRSLDHIASAPYSPTHLFAAGFLLDVPTALLAIVSQGDYARLNLHAKRNGVSFGEAFLNQFAAHPGHLGAIACSAWGLPEMFGSTMANFMTPWAVPSEFDVLACLCCADHVASNSFDMGVLEFTGASQLPPEVAFEFDLSANELERLRASLSKRLDLFHRPEA